MRKALVLFVAFVLGLSFAQESNTDIGILQALSEDEDFSTLVGLLEQAGLSEQLSGEGPFTLFAPSNEVFEGLDQTALDELAADPALLEQLLLSHVVEGAYSVNDLQDAEEGSLVTLQGEPLTVDTTAGGLRVNGAGLVSGNVENEYANGVVQGVNYLIVPASLQAQYGPDSALAQGEGAETAETAAEATDVAEAADQTGAAAEAGGDTQAEEVGEAATAEQADDAAAEGETTILQVLQDDGRFGTLLGAVGQAGLAETLQGEGPFTLFAPTDAAFEALPAEQLDAILNDPAALERLLLYHVTEGDMLAADMTEAGPLTTLEGSDIAVTMADGGVMFNEASLVGEDLVASNGVVHAINHVLLPPDMME